MSILPWGFHDSKPHKSNNRNRQSTTDNLDLGESCMFDEVSRYVHVNADQNLWHVQQLVTMTDQQLEYKTLRFA